MKELKISWNTTYKAIKKVSEDIKNNCISYDSMLVLNRGSMVFGGILGYKLGIRRIEYMDIDVIYTKNYTEIVKKIINSPLERGTLTGKVLFVTDIVHSGNTIMEGVKQLKKEYPNNLFDFATLFYIPNNNIKPKYYYKLMKKKKWIVFPWDEVGYVPMSNHI
ncbi:hypothetical protein COV24_00815 [candidate division WWE3 bacterium CG10_big_fil_rev_8_21_14_0_10_32_10]|uniref:Phosphoribosyltransferase domain-containing protein n=1 Tax=candidate division WWE3 bacterium CG10_big_fil_rev_8_21_14_0_10_32_10 TaxID=1975090 RepID=A0A2H0RD71_UNCKA|nr:MAG: hypothetical protein COV24_00815 [candidate division WWE3 bacterium CG10_big_fil_rev_8_21_14_0_10_32_10]